MPHPQRDKERARETRPANRQLQHKVISARRGSTGCCLATNKGQLTQAVGVGEASGRAPVGTDI